MSYTLIHDGILTFLKDKIHPVPVYDLPHIFLQVLQVTSKEDFDMDKLTEDNMTEMMEKMEKDFVAKAVKNDGLCKRLMGIMLEAKEKNIL